MKSQTSLVGAKGGVELHAVSPIDLEVAGIVLPDDSELDDALGDGSDLESGPILGVLLKEGAVLESARKLVISLLELGLGREMRHCVEVIEES